LEKNLDFNNDEANIDPNMLQKFQYLKEEINGIFSQENIATIKGGFSDTCSKGHIHSHDLSTAERGKIQKKVKNVLRSFLESVNTPIPPYLNEYEDDVRGILEFYDQMKEDIGELMTTGMNLRGNKCGAVDEVPKVSPEVKTTLEQLAEENLDVYNMPLTTLKRVVQEVSQVFDRASQIFGFSTDNKMTRFTNFSSLSTVLNKRRLGQSKPSIITRVSSCSSVDSDYSRAPLLGRRS
jgi:gas vesicle protein